MTEFDTTPTPNPTYDSSKVPGEIRKIANYVRTKYKGEDILEAIAQSSEIAGVIANEALEAQSYDGNSLADVTLAKDGLPTLDARIRRDVNNLENKKADKSEVTTQLAHKANKTHVWSMANMGQDVKEAMTGGSVAVVGEDAVGWVNAGSTLRTVLDGVSRNRTYYKFIMGGIDADNPSVPNQNRDLFKGILEQVFIEMKAGETIVLDDPQEIYQMSVVVHDVPQFIDGWNTRQYTAPKDEAVSVQVKRADSQPADFEHMGMHFYLVKPVNTSLIQDGAVTTDKLEGNVRSYVNLLSQEYEDFPELTSGSVDPTESPVAYKPDSAYVRAILASLQPIQLHDGDKIILTDTNKYSVAFAIEGMDTFPGLWSNSEYTASGTQLVSPMFRISADYEAASGSNIISDLDDLRASVKIKRNSNKESTTRYVSLNGSDDNAGTSETGAFATLQKALDVGADTIYVQAGTYYNQSVNKEIDKVSILVYGASEGNTQAVFKGSDLLVNWESSSGIYRTAYSGNTRFNRVFIDKTLPISTTGTRPTYNAVLWEGDNGETDYKMKPVLTLAQCQSEVGTFFYDGTHVYINPNDINSEFNATKLDVGMSLSGNELVMKGIVFDYYTGNPMRITNFKSVDVFKSGANHSSSQDGWNLNYSFGRLSLCEGIKNRNDGFNNHWYGDIVLENCRGINNYDDGASPHEDCSMTFYGGEYRGNGKGGISPVQQARVSAYGVKIIDNGWTLWNNTDTGTESNYVNCLMLNNNSGIMSILGGKVTLINCVEQGNGADRIEEGSIVEKY